MPAWIDVFADEKCVLMALTSERDKGEVPAWLPYTHAMACARKTCFKYIFLKESIFLCLKKLAFQYVCVTVFSAVLFPKQM